MPVRGERRLDQVVHALTGFHRGVMYEMQFRDGSYVQCPGKPGTQKSAGTVQTLEGRANSIIAV